MPKRSSGSVKVRSPDRAAVVAALADWARRLRASHPEVERVGYFGSYARGDPGPASDLDVLLVLGASEKPPHRRIIDYPVDGVPVGVEVFPFTAAEIAERSARPGSWMASVMREVRFLE